MQVASYSLRAVRQRVRPLIRAIEGEVWDADEAQTNGCVRNIGEHAAAGASGGAGG